MKLLAWVCAATAVLCKYVSCCPACTLSVQAPFYLVVETSGSSAAHDGEKVERFLEDVMGQGLVLGEPRLHGTGKQGLGVELRWVRRAGGPACILG